MNFLSIATINWLFSALSVLLQVLNSSKASSCYLLMSAICGPVDPAGIVGCCPGLVGGMNGVDDRIASTASLTVIYR